MKVEILVILAFLCFEGLFLFWPKRIYFSRIESQRKNNFKASLMGAFAQHVSLLFLWEPTTISYQACNFLR